MLRGGDGEFSSFGVYAIGKVQKSCVKKSDYEGTGNGKGGVGDGEFSSLGAYVIRKVQKSCVKKSDYEGTGYGKGGVGGR